MKLYHIPASCSLSPHIIAHETGLDITLIKVDYNNHVTDEGANYYDVNALGYVPALEIEEGRILREGPAIVQYLADLKPELNLAPPNGTFERYQLQECLNFYPRRSTRATFPCYTPGCPGNGWKPPNQNWKNATHG